MCSIEDIQYQIEMDNFEAEYKNWKLSRRSKTIDKIILKLETLQHYLITKKYKQLASAVCLNRQHCGNYKGGQMATKTAEGKLVIPDNVFKAISIVRDSGVINMASFNQLLELVPSDVSSWLQDNKEIYMEGFFYGFVPESQNT